MNDTPKRLLPVLIGMALTVVLLAALGYLANLRRNAATAPPTLTVIAPTTEPADSPLIIQFTSSAPLELTANGWVSSQWHLHARVNDVEYMPAAAEITTDGAGYRWTIPAVGRGPLSFHLGWADQAHREIASSRTPPVQTNLQ
jgi:hypothetical protein